MDTTSATIDRRAANHALVTAAQAATLAPSIHNTQPWRWWIHGVTANLYADTSRQLRIADPSRRLLTLSCGAALHLACVSLAASGVAVEVVRIADPDDADRHRPALDGSADPDHLATITVTGRTVVTPAAVRLSQNADARHTDRSPLLNVPLPETALSALSTTATRFGVGLYRLSRGQIGELATASFRAYDDQIHDAAARAELDAWTDPQRPVGAGVPNANIPDLARTGAVPIRDFGHPGTLAVPDGRDSAADYVILYGLAEQPRSWLRAGEALSAIWLTAIEHTVAMLPLSAAVEESAIREQVHRILSGLGYPYLTLRLGVPDPTLPTPPRTPRLPIEETIQVLP